MVTDHLSSVWCPNGNYVKNFINISEGSLNTFMLTILQVVFFNFVIFFCIHSLWVFKFSAMFSDAVKKSL
jgi:hypothetical protein